MEWEIEINADRKYIEVMTSGTADKDSSLTMAIAIARKMRTNRIRKALIDHRGLSGVRGDSVDIAKRPKLLRLIGMLLDIRIAEIIKPEHFKHFKFFETACTNQGFKVAIFQDKEEALVWLLG